MISRGFIDNLAAQIGEEFSRVFSSHNVLHDLSVSYKQDKTPVTHLDLFISNLIKEKLKQSPELSNIAFYSEEDFNEKDFYRYPVAFVDPIDGTRELSNGLPECALSIGILNSPHLNDAKNFGLILNPFSGFEFSSLNSMPITPLENYKAPLLGFVSRSEWEAELFKKAQKSCSHTKLIFAPRGSIAYKLGLLASGACDFVVTLRSKQMWDIAGGSILCARHGFCFYEQGQKVEKLDKMNFKAPLIWCREKDFDFLSKILR